MESPCSSLALFPWQQLWVVKSETEIPKSLQAASYRAGLTAPSATCWLNITSAADLHSDLTGSPWGPEPGLAALPDNGVQPSSCVSADPTFP